MKKRIIFCFLFLVFIMANGNAQERRPVAVSPGSEIGVAVVGQSCPTFSWSAVQWTKAYKVVVFKAVESEVLAYEEMEAVASPVISKEIRGPALSWSPSENERLSNGEVYIWYVQAVDDNGVGIWSEGRMFKVEEAIRLVGVEEKIRKSLREFGVSEETVDKVLEDVKSGIKEVDVRGMASEESGGTTPIQFGIQGTEGTHNTFYGLNAGASTTGNYNSLFGVDAGFNNTTGERNTFIGHHAGRANTTGEHNTFIGAWAGQNNTGLYNTFIGHCAGGQNTYAAYNTFIGDGAGYVNSTGGRNTFIGYQAGMQGSDTNNNTFIGWQAGYNNYANFNTFIGYDAGYFNYTGEYLTLLGAYAGRSNTTGDRNTFIGYAAGYRNTTGVHNLFLGYNAGRFNTVGDCNLFLGYNAGRSNTTGDRNTFIGHAAGYRNTTGVNNLFLGYNAGRSNTTGNRNTFVGHAAGYNNTTGSRNIFLGFRAGYYETGFNRLYIDNSDTSSPLIYGRFDTDIVIINGKLGIGMDPTNLIDVAGGAYCNGTTWVDASSREYKENIESLNTKEAMDALDGIRPVKFNYKRNKEEVHVGFIAEEVPELVAMKERKGMSAMDVVAVLTKVLQEQQEMISELKERITELEKENQEK